MTKFKETETCPGLQWTGMLVKSEQIKSDELENEIKKNLKGIGYEI